jgi:4-hydroxybenzoate polyprenyltransferase
MSEAPGGIATPRTPVLRTPYSVLRTLKPYAQLVRLPNVFTALADIGLGWLAALATGTPASRWPVFALLLLTSACLYCAGMVWNDFFDLEQDRKERPFRPLPSGRVSRRAAARLGLALLAAGLLFAAVAGWANASGTPVVLAALLVAGILAYDRWLKRTRAGPLGMGTCRFLNVLLGLSVAGALPWPWGFHLALVVGVYIVGVTWFARTEARANSRHHLAAAAAVMLAGLLLALPVPLAFEPGTSSPLFPYLLVALGFLVGLPVVRAVRAPAPPKVQAAVKWAIMGLLVLDAILATAVAGLAGLVILLLLPPALYLGRWLYST